MRALRQWLWSVLVLVALTALGTAPAQAQAKVKHKHYVVSSSRAIIATRRVLVRRGYHIVRVDRAGPTHVLYFRRWKGRGPIQRLVIRTVRDRVVFEETEPSVLVDIDVELKLQDP
jgi:hypothetical protein